MGYQAETDATDRVRYDPVSETDDYVRSSTFRKPLWIAGGVVLTLFGLAGRSLMVKPVATTTLVADTSEPQYGNVIGCLETTCNGPVGALYADQSAEAIALQGCLGEAEDPAKCFSKQGLEGDLYLCAVCKKCIPGSVSDKRCASLPTTWNDVRGSPVPTSDKGSGFTQYIPPQVGSSGEFAPNGVATEGGVDGANYIPSGSSMGAFEALEPQLLPQPTEPPDIPTSQPKDIPTRRQHHRTAEPHGYQETAPRRPKSPPPRRPHPGNASSAEVKGSASTGATDPKKTFGKNDAGPGPVKFGGKFLLADAEALTTQSAASMPTDFSHNIPFTSTPWTHFLRPTDHKRLENDYIPTDKEIQSNIPTKKDIEGGIKEDVNDNVPTKGDVEGSIPTGKEITSNIPTGKDIASNVPSDKEIVSNIPTQNIPPGAVKKIENGLDNMPSQKDIAHKIDDDMPNDKDLSHTIDKHIDDGVDHMPGDLPAKIDKQVDSGMSSFPSQQNAVAEPIMAVSKKNDKRLFNLCMQMNCNSQTGGLGAGGAGTNDNTQLMRCIQLSNTPAEVSHCFKLHPTPAGSTLRTCLICKKCIPGHANPATCLAVGRDPNDIRSGPF